MEMGSAEVQPIKGIIGSIYTWGGILIDAPFFVPGIAHYTCGIDTNLKKPIF